MNRFHRSVLCIGVAVLGLGAAHAAPPPGSADATPVASTAAAPPRHALPTWTTMLTFAKLGSTSDVKLSGLNHTQSIGFGVPRSRIVTAAVLHLHYTPSPALVPGLSQLRIYLNDALAGVLTIGKGDLGHPVKQDVPLNPQLLTGFNQLRIEFAGQDAAACENPASPALWLNLAHDSAIELTEQPLAADNNLAAFPSPFFDRGSNTRLVLPFVFPAAPSAAAQQAAAILASYFGSLAAWRGVSFPATFGHLPPVPPDGIPRYLVAFVTNGHRPTFLADIHRYPPVTGPTIELADNPANPYIKMLLVWGRNDGDLVTAARALASGDELMHGDQVTLTRAPDPNPRQPYDAPEWVPTNGPVALAKLVQSGDQLETSGLPPYPVGLEFKLPPDLFVWHTQGALLRLIYRYTDPGQGDRSNLNLFVNNRFFASLPLSNKPVAQADPKVLRINILPADADTHTGAIKTPALALVDSNRLRFDFGYGVALDRARAGFCQTQIPTVMHAGISGRSTLNVSGYYHYMSMPNLYAFSQSAWPFSRMADLSGTVAMVPRAVNPALVSTLLDVIGQMGAEIGYPALGLRLTDDWKTAVSTNANLLVFGPMPADLRQSPTLSGILAGSRRWLQQAIAASIQARPSGHRPTDPPAAPGIHSGAGTPVAAIVGMQSPFYSNRSVVALLATTPADYGLLQTTFGDSGKRAAVTGSVALIRPDGIYSGLVGDRYTVGHLPWWMLVWYRFSSHPVLVALLTLGAVLLLALLLRQGLHAAARRRLSNHG